MGHRAQRLLSFLNPPRVTVRYGPPRVLKRARGQDSQTVADALMCEIAAMLPPRYRGVYGAARDGGEDPRERENGPA